MLAGLRGALGPSPPVSGLRGALGPSPPVSGLGLDLQTEVALSLSIPRQGTGKMVIFRHTGYSLLYYLKWDGHVASVHFLTFADTVLCLVENSIIFLW